MSPLVTSAQTVVMREYGPPAVLRLEPVPVAAPGPGDVCIRTIAAAVNHSDLEIRAGHWPIRRQPPFPYVPGLEVVGDVVATGARVAGLARADRVITMMQGLGGVRAERPGGYAEYVTVAAAAAARLPPGIDPMAMAALGLAAVTAYEGWRRMGAIAGRRVLVTGAGGGVGSAAVGLAVAMGAEVVAMVNRREQADAVRSLGATAAVLPDEVASGAVGSVDGILDTVAGPLFGALVNRLNPGGTLSLVGAVAGHDVTFDAYRLLDISLTGYNSETLDGATLAPAVKTIAGWVADGTLQTPRFTVLPLRRAAEAHDRLERRTLTGRVLLVPDAAAGATGRA